MIDLTLFEAAAIDKLRFDSFRGQLIIEDLFDLPLLSTKAGQPDLDTLARGIHHELQQITTGSFVEARPNPAKAQLELKLNILKRVIEIKQAQNAARVKAAANAAERKRLLDLIARKQDQALEGEDLASLQARLATLGDD